MNTPKILNEWINRKLKAYKKQPRRGISKGNSLPIPKNKFHCALLHLRYTKVFDLAQIAKETKVHTTLVRKWRTESKFLEQIGELTKEYAHYFLKCILTERRSFRRDEINYYSLLLWTKIKMMLGSFAKESKNDKESLFILNKLTLDFCQARLDYWGSKQEKIDYYSEMQKLVPKALQVLRESFNRFREAQDWKQAQELYNDLSLRYENLSEGFHNYRKRLLKRGLI